TVRPVGACPVPPPPPPPPPPPIILQGKILHLTATTIGNLLKHGWSDLVGLSEGGTVTQDLYLEDGTMPAYAARSHRHRPPAQLLAKGSASSRTAGKVTVVLHVSPRARGRLRAAKSLHVVLITTIRSSSGTRLNLPRRQFVLHR
ncbi:MAG TPA: hypothetical protein VN772_07290, partial [Solirubrobacteraceae bacterium]|nr:hypothetical protein [Solirubrobacteraceae bacterium]